MPVAKRTCGVRVRPKATAIVAIERNREKPHFVEHSGLTTLGGLDAELPPASSFAGVPVRF
jgi:hypothetical protein